MILMWLLHSLLVLSVSTFLAAQTSNASSTSATSGTTGVPSNQVNQATSEPSVRYIESNVFGNFFMAFGKTINDASVNSTMIVNKECACRFQCLTKPSCMAVSTEVNGTGFLCKFANLGPIETTLDDISYKNATYIYRHASLTGKTWGFRKDQLYYFEFPNWMTFPQGKEACEKIPGFRLVIIRSKEIMLSFHTGPRAYYLDLHKKDGGRLVWGDSTPFNNSENIEIRYVEAFTPLSTEPFARPVFFFYVTFMHDQILGNVERVICQANPLGVDW